MAHLDPVLRAHPVTVASGTATIDTPDGPMAALTARPAGAGPFGAIIMFPHVGGLTDTMMTMARRAAEGGYFCVVPDLYHRLGTIVIDPQSADPTVHRIRDIAAGSVTPVSAMADTRAVLDWLKAHPQADARRRGAIGYGRSGSLALLAAARFPPEIGAAASVLGFGFVTDAPDSPHLSFSSASGEFYCAFAEHDEIIPRRVVEDLAAVLGSSSIPSEVVVHRGARHPYAFPDRDVYDRAAAEADWARIFSLFARRLSLTS